MHNPYAHVPAPAPSTPEEQRIADYESAIGPNTGYYLKRFQEFDAGESKAGWHWPAFFATSGWFLYRKMWAVGLVNLFWPLILIIAVGLIAAILRPESSVALAGFALLLILPSILLPIYANALYWRHVRKQIEDLPASVAGVPEQRRARLERNGGTSPGATAGVLVGVGFFGIFVVGILAAIAIPAYQDYTIRSQVVEGLNLASPVKHRVAEHWATHQSWPQQADLGNDAPIGKFVTSVNVASGSIVITYGDAAHTNIAGQRLVLLPGVTNDGEVVWACANAPLPEGVNPGDGPYGSDVPDKYLPSSCRTPR